MDGGAGSPSVPDPHGGVTDQRIFAALADSTRRSLYERLTIDGPASASRLATELPVSRQAIAKHLGILDDAGLVSRSRQGREVVYSAELSPLDDVATWMSDVGSAWEERLKNLKRGLE
jgi:DNA-binding transcriptional ArsR family regulator